MKTLFALLALVFVTGSFAQATPAPIDERDIYATEHLLANKLCKLLDKVKAGDATRQLCASRGEPQAVLEAEIARTILPRISKLRTHVDAKQLGLPTMSTYAQVFKAFPGETPKLQVTCLNEAVALPSCHVFAAFEHNDDFAVFLNFTVDATIGANGGAGPLGYKIVDDRSNFYSL